MKKNNSLWVHFTTISIFAGVMALFIVGCVPEATDSVEELFTETPSFTSTPTINWFPTTETPTEIPLPTETPNPAAIPSYGEELFSDSFNTNGSWQTVQNANGSVSVDNSAITLAVKASKGNLIILRENTIVSDFYLETTVKRVSLCKTDDQFGVVFRALDDQNYYRLMINCQGSIAVQQMAGSTPSFLMNWTPNSQISLWQPYTLGVWAKGQTLRIYINNQLQTELVRGTFSSGGIGYFAKAAADTPLTVSFSDLHLYNIPKNVGITLSTVTPIK